MEESSGTEVNPGRTKKTTFARPNKEEESEIKCMRYGIEDASGRNGMCNAISEMREMRKNGAF